MKGHSKYEKGCSPAHSASYWWKRCACSTFYPFFLFHFMKCSFLHLLYQFLLAFLPEPVLGLNTIKICTQAPPWYEFFRCFTGVSWFIILIPFHLILDSFLSFQLIFDYQCVTINWQSITLALRNLIRIPTTLQNWDFSGFFFNSKRSFFSVSKFLL